VSSGPRFAARRPPSGPSPGRPGLALGPLLPILFAAGLAFVMVFAFIVMDYKFDQQPHRLFKIMLGVTMLGAILVWPRVGLTLLPVATPFLVWLPKIPVPTLNPLNVLLLGIFGAWALPRVLSHLPLGRPGRLSLVFVLIVVLAGVSIVRGAAFPTGYSYDAAIAATTLWRSALTFALYYITLWMIRGEKDRRTIAWAIVAGLLLEALVTIRLGRSGEGARADGSFGQSNELGAFLSMYTVFAVAMIPAVRHWLGRLALFAAAGAGCFAIILTLSRGALVAILIGLLFVTARSSKALLGILIAVLLTSPFWAPDFLTKRIQDSTVEVKGSDERALDPAAEVRIDTWKAILTVVGEHPLDGVGFNGLIYVLPEAGAALGLEVVETAHNTYLRFLAEMGILGLLLLLWTMFCLVKLGWDATRVAGSRFDRALGVGLTGTALTLAVNCVFGDRFFSILTTGNFWMMCALADDLLSERARGTA
jgi:O-antigen ligase